MSKILVCLVTHSSYKDICDNFIELFNKYWYDCKYDFRVLAVGEKIFFGNYKTINYGIECTLPGAIYKFMVESNYDYCISFLGDAFINGKVENKDVENLIDVMQKNKLSYCNLIPKAPYRLKKYLVNNNLRYISKCDSYGISFVAFIASREFVLDEFKNDLTDLEFERKYLKLQECSSYVYKDKVILTDNIFNIVPGIYAGKWERRALRKLKKNNNEIIFSKRDKNSLSTALRNNSISVLQIFASPTQRRYLKKFMSKFLGMKFTTHF